MTHEIMLLLIVILSIVLTAITLLQSMPLQKASASSDDIDGLFLKTEIHIKLDSIADIAFWKPIIIIVPKKRKKTPS